VCGAGYPGRVYTVAVVPGSFDPVTVGHVDIIGRAVTLFNEVHVVVVHNPKKKPLFPMERRVELVENALAHVPSHGTGMIRVASWTAGLLVDYCGSVGATILVKGLRSHVDMAYETPMALVNRDLAAIETVFLVPDPTYAHVSSSLVRQVAALGGDITSYVPSVVAECFKQL
jgi:pantetheine-phosphate adenylyltransferase